MRRVMMTNLQKIRIQNQLTRKELANLSGVHQETIKHIEHESLPIENCKLVTLIKISSALGCKVIDLLPKDRLEYIC